MTTTPSGSVGRAVDRVLGRDTPSDVLHVVGLFALFGLLESLTRRLARVPAGRLTGSVLLQAAAVSHPVSVAVPATGSRPSRPAASESRCRRQRSHPTSRTGSPPPTLDSDEPIQRLDVYVLTAIHHDDAPETRRELVFTIVRRDDGTVEVVTPPPAD